MTSKNSLVFAILRFVLCGHLICLSDFHQVLHMYRYEKLNQDPQFKQMTRTQARPYI